MPMASQREKKKEKKRLKAREKKARHASSSGNEESDALAASVVTQAHTHEGQEEEEAQPMDVEERPNKRSSCETSTGDGNEDEEEDSASKAKRLRRHEKKIRKKLEKNGGVAKDYYDIYGPDVRASIELNDKGVRWADLQQLVLWLLVHNSVSKPTWILVNNKPLVESVAVAFVPGLSFALHERKKAQLKNVARVFGDARMRPMDALEPMVHEMASTAAMLTRPFSRNAMDEKKRTERASAGEEDGREEQGEHATTLRGGGGVGRSPAAPRALLVPEELTLALDVMVENNYPIPARLRAAAERARAERSAERDATKNNRLEFRSAELVNTDDFEQTQPSCDADDGDVFYEMLALDCEMCLTKEGLELTRMSIVASDGKVIVDTLVLPRNEITDYNTRYSGITEEMLADVTTRLEDARAMMLKVCRAETFLVGHSLENDLVALRVTHMNVCDTSLLYMHARGPPFKPALRHLAEKFLRRRIQEGEHCSIQDAQATMELMQLKLRHGHAFGGPGSGNEMLCDRLSKAGKRSVLVDRQRILKRYATGNTSAIPVSSDADAAAAACTQAKNATNAFLWVQFTGLAEIFERSAWARRCAVRDAIAAAKASADSGRGSMAYERAGRAPAAPANGGTGIEIERASASVGGGAEDDDGVDAVLARMDTWIGDMYDSLPTNSILVLASGQGDTAHTRAVLDEKAKRLRNSPGLSEWNEESEKRLRVFCQDAKRAICFVAVKEPA